MIQAYYIVKKLLMNAPLPLLYSPLCYFKIELLLIKLQ